MNDFTEWIEKRTEKLLSSNLYDNNGNYDEIKIRQLLIFALHLNEKATDFFNLKSSDKDLLNTLIDIALCKIDDYSIDAKIKAVDIICKFDKFILKKEKERLKKLSNSKLDSIAQPIKQILKVL